MSRDTNINHGIYISYTHPYHKDLHKTLFLADNIYPEEISATDHTGINIFYPGLAFTNRFITSSFSKFL